VTTVLPQLLLLLAPPADLSCRVPSLLFHLFSW